MRIALVYDLRDDYRALGFSEEEIAEFDNIDTIDQLEGALRALHCEVVRVGRGQVLAARLAAGERFDLVFSIAEGLKGRSREAQVPALCELFDQPYLLSDPLTSAVALDKAVAKRLVRDAGVPTPAFMVASSDASELAGWSEFPAFVKPIAEGTGKGCESASVVNTSQELAAAAAKLLTRYHQPVLVETYLPGREFTVGIVGNGEDATVLGVCEILLKEDAEANIYSLHNKELCEELVIYQRADDDEARLAGDTRACRLSCASVPRRRPHRLPLQRLRRALFPRGQSARRAASASLRSSHSRRAERHLLRRADRHDPRRGARALRPRAARYGAGAETRLMALKPHGFIPVVHAATKDRPDEIDTLISAEAVAAALADLGFVTEVVAVDLDLNHFHALKRRDPLLVFNLVDAVRGDCRLAPVIPSLLDAVGLPYTGAHSDAWLETLSKVATKLKLEQAGLPTPGFSVDGAGLDPDATFIVKAVWEHGSLGLDQSSVVKGGDVARVIEDRNGRFGTEHFAERYIEGREFNLALLEERARARVLPTAEILFEDWDQGTPRIVGYDAKWTSDSEAYIGTPRRFGLETNEPALAAQLEKLGKSCWDLFNLAGYARVDFRIDAESKPWILEVNVNPCLNPDAGFTAAAAAAGLSYRELIGRIIDAAPRALQAIA